MRLKNHSSSGATLALLPQVFRTPLSIFAPTFYPPLTSLAGTGGSPQVRTYAHVRNKHET